MGNPIGFGRSNALPMRVGGGESTVESLFQALLDEYALGFSAEEFTENWCEVYGEAVALSIIYAVNGRVSNQLIPERMQENLSIWEEVLGLHVVEDTPLVQRRRAVAAKLQTMVKNALIDIENAARKAMGKNFDELRVTPLADVYFYMPGLNPGPEGWTFTSNRAVITIVVNKSGINEAVFLTKTTSLSASLSGMVPGWQVFVVGVDQGDWVPNVGTVDQTLL